MHCGVNRYRGQLRRQADATNAVAAFDLAERFAREDVKDVVARFVAGLQCPQGCRVLEYDRHSLSIKVGRVWGAPSPDLPGHYRILVQADYTFEVHCKAASLPPVTEDQPPVPDVDEGPTPTPGPGGGPAVPVPVPAPGPCVVTFTIDDRSSRNGTGVFEWIFDVTVTANASNPAHTWAPGSCRITAVNISVGGAPLSWTAANALGQTTNLMTGYGLTITPGAGVATLQGTLVPGTHGIAPMPGSMVQVKGTAVDSAGNTDDFEFFLKVPSN